MEHKELIERINEMNGEPTPEHKRFKVFHFFNSRLVFCQDLTRVNFQLSINYNDVYVHSWAFALHVLFWGVEFG